LKLRWVPFAGQFRWARSSKQQSQVSRCQLFNI
jgi:hypothetical protein